MEWQLKSPGIWQIHYNEWVITKILLSVRKTNKITNTGSLQEKEEYNYIAVRPGTKEKEFTKITASTWEKIVSKIANQQQLTLL